MNKLIKVEKYANLIWLVAILSISGIGSAVLAYYVWPRVTIPFEVKEPIEIINYTPELSLFPGETKDFNATVQNNSPVTYNMTLDFSLSDLVYQANFVTFSDEIYLVPPGQQDLAAWVKVKSSAPTVNCSLTVDFKRVERIPSPGIGEDFTDETWIENDPNNHIIIIGPNHVDFVSRRDEDAYLYKDMGEGYFTDFENLLTVRVNNLDGSDYATVWALTNDVDDMKGLIDNERTYIQVVFYGGWSEPYHRIWLEEGYGSPYSITTDYCGVTLGTTYYLKIGKTGTSLYCEIYSDASRTNLLTTLTLTLGANHSFRYIFVCNTYNSGHTLTCSIDIDNLIL